MRTILYGLLAATALVSPSLAQTPYYEGKTITVLIGQGAGGNIDLFMRSFAPYMRKYIPGNPNIIVQNMTGGGTVRATNYLAEVAKPDGLTILYGPWEPISQVLELPEFRANYTDFSVIGGVSDQRVAMIRSDVPPGIKVPEDLGKVTEPFIAAGSNPAGFVNMLNRISLDVLKVPHKFVTGYKGGADAYAAILQNQAQFTNASYATMISRYGDFIKDGTGIAAFAFCYAGEDGKFERFKSAAEVPCLSEVYEKIHGAPPSDTVWGLMNWYLDLGGRVTNVALAPKGTPQEAVDALVAGFNGAAADAELAEQILKANGEPMNYVTIEEARRAVQSLADTPPEYITLLKEYVRTSQQ